MKFTSIITPAVVATCATALPTLQKRDCSTGPFSVTALRSGSPIHFQSVNASGQRFWINVPTATFCPSEVNTCPPGTETVWANTNALVSSLLSYTKDQLSDKYKGRGSPRRPASLRRPFRCSSLHPSPFRQHPHGLFTRSLRIHTRHSIRNILDQRIWCYGFHGLSQ